MRTSPADVEAALRRTRAEARGASDPRRKGERLEQTMVLLFRTLPGLGYLHSNWRSEVEEIDLVIRNESPDPVLAREGGLWLVECKNWSKAVDPQTVTSFRNKLHDKHGRIRLGFFVAASGFTGNGDPVLSRMSNQPELVIPIDGTQLSAWIDASDRVAWLKHRVEQAALRAG